MPSLRSSQSSCFLLALLSGLCVILTACAGSAGSGAVASAPRAQVNNPIAGAQASPALPVAGPLVLPAPASLTRSSSAGSGDRRLDGSEFDPLLPNARVFAAAANLSFAPAGGTMSGVAYAIYHFDLPAFGGSGSIETTWDSLPASGNFYLGVADFQTNSWQWLSADPAAVTSLPAAIDFSSPTEQVYVAVLLTGTDVHALQEVLFGGDQPPLAVIHSQYNFANSGTKIDFDASASTDDSSIDRYEWDLDGNGSFETDGGTNPATSKIYPAATSLTVQLRVTDDTGQSATSTTEIVVDGDGYDEVEPNNGIATANLLPGPGLRGWEGNLGPGGYDGSTEDYYKISITDPMRVEFRLALQSTLDSVQLILLDATGVNQLADSGPVTQNANLRFFFESPGDYLLCCKNFSLTAYDYDLSSTVDYSTDYDEVEPNNGFGEANVLNPDGVDNYWGNLGVGGYDGGNEDWYALEVLQNGLFYTFRADSYPIGLDLELQLFDSDGVTLLASSTYPPDLETIGYGFANSGTYYLQVQGAGGGAGTLGDYLLDVVNNGPMPEVLLTASPDNGTRPLTVNFDASGSTIPPDSYVVSYDWDLNGDGWYESQTTQSFPQTSCKYYHGDIYTAAVRINLVTGAAGVGYKTVNVSGTPSEIEPNSDYVSAQPIVFPLASFYGDVGQQGFDGSYLDSYSFNLPAGKTVQVDMESAAWFAPLGVAFVDYDGVNEIVLDSSVSNSGLDTISFTNVGADKLVYLLVYTDPVWGSHTGYMLSGSIF